VVTSKDVQRQRPNQQSQGWNRIGSRWKKKVHDETIFGTKLKSLKSFRDTYETLIYVSFCMGNLFFCFYETLFSSVMYLFCQCRSSAEPAKPGNSPVECFERAFVELALVFGIKTKMSHSFLVESEFPKRVHPWSISISFSHNLGMS